MNDITPAVILSAATLIFVILNFAFGRGDRGGARISALEAKQIADNAAREREITHLGHKIEMAAVTAKAGQEMSHRDSAEMKNKLDRLENLLSPLIKRLGLHVPAADEHR